jgi:hypothetical protein
MEPRRRICGLIPEPSWTVHRRRINPAIDTLAASAAIWSTVSSGESVWSAGRRTKRKDREERQGTLFEPFHFTLLTAFAFDFGADRDGDRGPETNQAAFDEAIVTRRLRHSREERVIIFIMQF